MKRNIIAFALILVWLLAAGPALRGEVKVVGFSSAVVGLDYNDKKAIVDGDTYYLARKAEDIIPASSSVLFVNFSRKDSISFVSQKIKYYVAPRSMLEVRTLSAFGKVRLSDYDYVIFHSFRAEDAFAFNRLYPDLKTLYSSRANSGIYALYESRKEGMN